ncbi:MAG: hypothetical protein F4Y44_06030 [Chloroflexi bacterium]|nr:hypothetical protein [Chloroflexota bacterium]
MMNVVSEAVSLSVPLIEQRLITSIPFNEDTFRYFVFDSLIRSGIDIKRLVLEYPSSEVSGEKIDTVILNSEGVIPEIAIEFKYHRSNPSGRNLPSTMSAGQLLADYAKLREFSSGQRIVVYLTDGEMLRYFGNSRNGLSMLLDLNGESEIFDGTLPITKTLREHAGDWSRGVRLSLISRWDLGSENNLFVWEIEPM